MKRAIQWALSLLLVGAALAACGGGGGSSGGGTVARPDKLTIVGSGS